MAAGMGSSCGACKFLRRKCAERCVFAPYFSHDQGAIHFAAVHKVFGASNVSKLLAILPVQYRNEAAVTISYEAQARIRDPVHGCVAHILALQHQVASLQEEIRTLTTNLTSMITAEASGLSPRAMDSQDRANYNFSSPNTTSAESSFGDQIEMQELPPMYREAIHRLEHSLFSEEPSSLEELFVGARPKDVTYPGY